MTRLENTPRRHLDAIGRLTRQIERDDANGLRRVRLADELDQAIQHLIRDLVAAARREGATWQQIGDQLNLPRQTAHRRYGPRR